MEIKGKVHCLFEQSGTFKKQFKNIGIDSEDYDIQNNFGETDHVIDLFQHIDDAYDGKPSLFDNITPDDLVMAFYPCIYFCQWSSTQHSWNQRQKYIKGKTEKENKLHIAKNVLRLNACRFDFYNRLVKFFCVCLDKDIRMIFENPYNCGLNYLIGNFLQPPSLIDMNRMKKGDYFVKPTAYWFLNCEPMNLETHQLDKVQKIISKQRGAIRSGLCSEERSLLSPDYARNFIADHIIGKPLGGRAQQQMFEFSH